MYTSLGETTRLILTYELFENEVFDLCVRLYNQMVSEAYI